MKILIVDDSRDARDLSLFQIKDAGIEAVGASSGTEALEILEHNTFDAVILDLSMPTLDGLEVAEQIRFNETLHQGKQPVKIAFYTGMDIDDPIKRIAKKTGVEKIFIKTHCYLPDELRSWLG